MAFDIGIHHFAWVKIFRHETKSVIVGMDCHDFGTNKLTEIYPLLVQYLSNLAVYNVDVILIEQQMNRMNIKATKLGIFVLAFFMIRYPDIRVIEYPALLKTKVFGADGLTKAQRKSFSINYVTTNYLRDDPVAYDWLQQFKKKDDICDCILMVESYCVKKNL